MINLQEFLDGYKTSEVELGDRKWKFREPRMRDSKLSVIELLEKNCIEGERSEFLDIVNGELPISKQKEVIQKILEDLGLV